MKIIVIFHSYGETIVFLIVEGIKDDNNNNELPLSVAMYQVNFMHNLI